MKQAFDSINPAVLKTQPIQYRILFWTWKTSKFPQAKEVLDTVYKRRETVKTTIEGIKIALLLDTKRLENQFAEVLEIYKGLQGSHKCLVQDIYFGEIWHVALHQFAKNLTDEIEKRNIEAVLAELTTQINTLKTEEQLYMQFFANTQVVSRLVREKISQTNSIVRLLEQAVLANLGLRVVSDGIEKAVDLTQELGDVIASTMLDTANTNDRTAQKLRKAREEGVINLEILQQAVDVIVKTLDDEAESDRRLIEKGTEVGKKLSGMTEQLRKHIVI
jgi:uncharacterized protein YaaN involved in tellurite resistance